MTELPGQQDGLLVLDKPKGPSSAQCLERIKHGLRQKKIGHAGTLDPMASGVLLVLLGQGTKIAQYLLEGDKVYSGCLRLGLSTDTYDMEGRVTAEAPYEHIAPEEARDAVLSWSQSTEQIVPPYSAAKHKGKPLYRLAREGKETPLKTTVVRIPEVLVLSLDLPWIRFRVTCGAGVYIRSLVHSLGIRLGCGATLTELTREYSCPFSLTEAHPLDAVLGEPEALAAKVLPIGKALSHWPVFTLGPDQTGLLKNGARLPIDPAFFPGEHALGQRALFLDPEGRPVGLVEASGTDSPLVWAIVRGLWKS